MPAANFAMKNPHTHSTNLGNQNATLQKILTRDEAKNEGVDWQNRTHSGLL